MMSEQEHGDELRLWGNWSRTEEVTAIIPAAGRVSEAMFPMSGRINSAMVPVAGKPVIYWTVDYLARLGVRRFIIAMREPGQFLEDFVRASFPALNDIRWVVPDGDRGLGYTIYCCARHLETQKALVVLGDTFFTFKQSWFGSGNTEVNQGDSPQSSFILTASVPDSYRWCMVEGEGGLAKRFVDKPAECEPGMQAAIGVYAFDNVPLLRVCVTDAVESKSYGNGSGPPAVQMSDILSRYVASAPVATCAPGEWMDCGNADNLARSHQRLLQQRAFNEVSIDPQLGIFSKRSQHAAKFNDEINYYKLLPARLSVLFPRMLESSIEPDNQFLSLEYYGYPTLAELWLYENLHTRIWERVLAHISEIISGPMATYRRDISPLDYRQMYVGKTRERCASVPISTQLGALVHDPRGITVNGRTCPPLRSIFEEVEAALPEIAGDRRQGIIHGDMCFSNILYDLRSGICKFIDPRGSFGQAGIYGDQKYDVAKLYHSVHGLYDFIVNDLFTVKVDGRDVTLTVHRREEHERVREVFDAVFFPTFDRRHVQMITALLFLSMPALHYDAPRRQLAMFATGMNLFAELDRAPVSARVRRNDKHRQRVCTKSKTIRRRVIQFERRAQRVPGIILGTVSDASLKTEPATPRGASDKCFVADNVAPGREASSEF
jgi:NDP-sugar pyrophosphorylase family protein